MLSTGRPVRAPPPAMDHYVEMEDDVEEAESETSQEYYPESEDEDGHNGACARTMYHAPRSDCDTANSTRSLFESDIEYTYINGRRYCDDYFLSNDYSDQERWQTMHQVFVHIFDLCLTTVPLEVIPKRILDIGCATGDWVLDMAYIYPDAEIIGTDIAPIQPTKGVPQNVFFEIDDAEVDGGWNFAEGFDLIHLRSMVGAFTSWTNVYKEAWKHLNPGGWIEVMDLDDNATILDFFKEEKIVLESYAAFIAAMEKSGRPFGADHLEEDMLLRLGFVDVQTSVTDMKMGAWGEDRPLSKILLDVMTESVEAMYLRPLTEYGGYDISEVEKICEGVKEAVVRLAGRPQTAEGCTFKVKVLRGRKPLEAPSSRDSNGDANGFLSPNGGKDADCESVATVTKESMLRKTNGHH